MDGREKGDRMIWYKCDVCSKPYAPEKLAQNTSYIETGTKTLNGKPSNIKIRDICPVCKAKINEFIKSLEPVEVEVKE